MGLTSSSAEQEVQWGLEEWEWWCEPSLSWWLVMVTISPHRFVAVLGRKWVTHRR